MAFVQRTRAPAAAALVLALLAARAGAQVQLPNGFVDEPIVAGLEAPVAIAFLPDGRLLVTEQLTARIRLVAHGALAPGEPVCTVPGVRNDNFFRGLQGIAVDPRWPAVPCVYVNYATTTGRVSLSRLTVTGDLTFAGNGALSIDPASRYEILGDLFDAAHNGGTLRFGPDQMLYMSVGDSFTVPCAAQRLESLRGVILRLDVRNLPAGPGGPPSRALVTPPDNPFVAHPSPNARLVWALGFRHPFRFHVDAATGDLLVADVGESTWEEIDHVTGPGQNFGWPIFEGPAPYTTCPGAPTGGFTAPAHAYGDGLSAISAGIYRRPSSGAGRFPPEYEGDAFFVDYYSGAWRRLKRSGSAWTIAAPVPGQPTAADWGTGFAAVSDVLEAADGSMWYCRQSTDFVPETGEIRRIRSDGVVSVRAGDDGGFAPPVARPMPAAHRVVLEFVLPRPAAASVRVYDPAGRLVATVLATRHLAAGRHETGWDLRRSDGGVAGPGLYFASLEAEGRRIPGRIVVAR